MGEQRRIQFIIDEEGNVTTKTLEGFSGTTCVEKLQQLNVMLGGEQVESGKTSAYYDPDYDNPVSVNIK